VDSFSFLELLMALPLYAVHNTQFMKVQFFSCTMLSGAGRDADRAEGAWWQLDLGSGFAVLSFFFFLNVSEKKGLLFFSLLPAQQQLLSFVTGSVLHQAISLLWEMLFHLEQVPALVAAYPHTCRLHLRVPHAQGAVNAGTTRGAG